MFVKLIIVKSLLGMGSLCNLQAVQKQLAPDPLFSLLLRLAPVCGADSQSLTSELAALNKQKVQVQREFEAFKDMAMQVRAAKGWGLAAGACRARSGGLAKHVVHQDASMKRFSLTIDQL